MPRVMMVRVGPRPGSGLDNEALGPRGARVWFRMMGEASGWLVGDPNSKILMYAGRHREDGPAIELDDGSKFWCMNDDLHREDGPAIESDGHRDWFALGQLTPYKDDLWLG